MSRVWYLHKFWIIGVVAAYLGVSRPAWTDEACLTVLYPQVREPYRAVLDEIMAGIEQAASMKVKRVAVPEDDAGEPLADRPECSAVIGLGRAGLKAASPFVSRMPVVAGAVLMQPGQSAEVPTISFLPDSEALFTRLKYFLPGVKTVTVVYDPEHSEALVEQAARTAKRMGIRLVAHKARDLQDAAQLYKRLLAESDPAHDAIWLIRDAATIDSGAVLTLVLEQAWKRRLVVFSDQPTHVKYGVLFSVYPDNVKLGERLARLAEKCAIGACNGHQVMLLTDLGTAVNSRTAQRLGIHIDRRNGPYTDLVLPASQ